MGWFQKTPIVSLLFVVALVAVPMRLAEDRAGDLARFDNLRAEARQYLVRNPTLFVDSLGALMLEPGWLADMRAAAAARAADGDLPVELPPRLLARSQARLDGMLEEAYAARMKSDPAWRHGVLDAQSPARNYLAHAFVPGQAAWAGIALGIAVLLLAGAPLERTWGSWVFGLFALAALPTTATAYRILDASSGVPWSGCAGLAGAVLGAYFIRGLGGHFLLPAWILLPVWLAVEAFVVRDFWIDDLGSLPWATVFASIGFGAACAGALRLMNVEARFDAMAASRRGSPTNPVVARAARLRSDGDPYQAFDLMQAAWRDDPGDEDVCEAFFSIAVEVGQPGAAASAILPSLRNALKKGDVRRAIDYWFPLASKRCEVALEATAAVRLGEALLDAGHPDEALFSLRTALDAGVSSAHAARIVNIARDLDEAITREAAGIALGDPTLDPAIRAQIAPVVAGVEDREDWTSDAEPIPESRSQLDRRVHAEHQVVETTAFPVDSDADLALDAPSATSIGLDVTPSAREADFASNERALEDQSLDGRALSEEHLAGSGQAQTGSQEMAQSGDVLSHWTDSTTADDVDLEALGEDLDADLLEEALLEPADLEDPDFVLGSSVGATNSGWSDPAEAETDTDLTPIMDSTDESTSPMSDADPTDAAGGEDAVAFDRQTVFLDPQAIDSPLPEVDRTELALRPLKALDAVPIQATEEWIDIDVDGRGKSKLPYARIEAIALAAVEGLDSRPVLVLDFLLNWSDDIAAPLKSIRFRSNRFDPRRFAPDAPNALDALTAWVAEIERHSGASCLPSRGLLEGRFEQFGSLADYERNVLSAEASRGA